LIFLFGSSQFSGNSARAKPKNEYDSVFACCCWFDEFCVFVAFVLRVRVRVLLLLLVLQVLLQPTLGAVVRAGRSSILKNKFVVVVLMFLLLLKRYVFLPFCVKKKRERETLRATDEQQVVKSSARERLEAFTTKKSGNLGRRKRRTNTHTHHHRVHFSSLSLFAGRKNTQYVHHQVSPNGGEERPVRARGIEMERPRRVCSHANEKNEREETTEIRERERLGVERSGGE